MFKDVLEKDEKVVKVYKPNKCKTAWWWFLMQLLGWIWLPLTALAAIDTEYFWMVFGISLGVTGLAVIITSLLGVLWYRNRFFAYTNKRILIRGGIIGIDYKSLEFKSLTATVVNVSLLDKLVRKHTGSVRFGSAASPMLSIWSGHSNQFMFQHIQKPYDVLREIKEFINEQE